MTGGKEDERPSSKKDVARAGDDEAAAGAAVQEHRLPLRRNRRSWMNRPASAWRHHLRRCWCMRRLWRPGRRSLTRPPSRRQERLEPHGCWAGRRQRQRRLGQRGQAGQDQKQLLRRARHPRRSPTLDLLAARR
uniref:Uncharacterized protein n=1 Tax=Setaria italica TaxID=4555 RepID=K3XZX9_SETIT